MERRHLPYVPRIHNSPFVDEHFDDVGADADWDLHQGLQAHVCIGHHSSTLHSAATSSQSRLSSLLAHLRSRHDRSSDSSSDIAQKVSLSTISAHPSFFLWSRKVEIDSKRNYWLQCLYNDWAHLGFCGAIYRRLRGRRKYFGTRMNNDVPRREDKERLISAHGWRTTNIAHFQSIKIQIFALLANISHRVLEWATTSSHRFAFSKRKVGT